MALADYAQGHHYSMQHAWLCLLTRFFMQMLGLTVTGHLAIATCRMCGFRVLRNTYRPLQSKTIAEYWNRYNYYFKELLAEFFFYPTYFRFFKNRQKLRIFFATLSAATFGNIIFHFLILSPVIISYGIVQTLKGFLPFTCYAIVLGIAIACSQLRNLSTPKKNNLFAQYISPIFILAFYAILELFNKNYQPESISINFKFFGSLFNMTW
jgi:hypothetical protein